MSQCERSLKINNDITLTQNTRGLTFGTDAYLLSAFVSGNSRSVCVDLGSGTGVIPLLLASRKKFKHIYAVEIQSDFHSLISKNVEENLLSDTITPLLADIRNVKSQDVGGEVDTVIANPPYMKIDSGKRNQNDEKFIARHEVFGTINDFCACASRILKHGGKFCVVWRPDRLTDLICALRENRLEPKKILFVHAYPQGQPSMALIQSIKGGACGAEVLRPLFLHSSKEDAINNILSDDAEQIYATGSFEFFNKKG